MRDDDERALLSRIAAGDQHALRCLYAAYRTRLWSYLFRQLDGDAGWTEELTQDVFVSVWRSAAGYRGDAQPATWLFRIAHNLAANARRARNRQLRGERFAVADEGDQREQRDDLPLATSHEDAVLDRLTLAAALDRLSPHHREALELAFVQGFHMDEIATIVGVPVGTVKSRISYARRALQTHLAAQEAADHVETTDRDERTETAESAGDGFREQR